MATYTTVTHRSHFGMAAVIKNNRFIKIARLTQHNNSRTLISAMG
jgi:hypothetical protein